MNIDQTLFIELLKESPTFRNYVADIIFEKDSFRQIVTQKVMSADNKIAAIRTISVFGDDNVSKFKESFPNLTYTTYNDGKETLSLYSAKCLVEELRSDW